MIPRLSTNRIAVVSSPHKNMTFRHSVNSPGCKSKIRPSIAVGQWFVPCQSYFNKTLIGQAGSISGKARQEVEVEKRDWEYSRKQEAPSAIPAQITEEATCELTVEKVPSHMANTDKNYGLL